MNKEELEKEAEEYLKKDGTKAEQIFNMLNEISPLKITSTQATFIIAMIKQVYQDGAEPREKRIAELEVQIKKMKCCGNCIHCYEGAYHNGYRCKDHARESVCDNWEWMTDEVRKEMLEDD